MSRYDEIYKLLSNIYSEHESRRLGALTFLQTQTMLLWKLQAEKKKYPGFTRLHQNIFPQEKRREPREKESTAKLINKYMADFAAGPGPSDSDRELFNLVLQHAPYQEADAEVWERIIKFLNGYSLKDLFDASGQDARSDYCRAFNLKGYSIEDLFDASGQDTRSDYCRAFQKIIAEYGDPARVASLPVDLSLFMSRVLNIQDKDRVFFAGCGVGTALLNCVANEPANYVYAQDSIITNALSARVHLALFGCDHSKVPAKNLLLEPDFIEEDKNLKKFDCVISLPQMGSVSSRIATRLRKDPFGRFPETLVGRRFTLELAHMAHTLHAMKPSAGRGAILLPARFLSIESSHLIRAHIVSVNYVDAVITIPRSYIPSLTFDMAVLVLKMDKQDENVLFVDNSSFKLDPDYLMDILQKRQDGYKGSMLVTTTKIHGNKYNLYPGRYRKDTRTSRPDLEQIKERIISIDTELKDVQDKLDRELAEVGMLSGHT